MNLPTCAKSPVHAAGMPLFTPDVMMAVDYFRVVGAKLVHLALRPVHSVAFETVDIRYTTANQRNSTAEVSGELVILNWKPEVLGGLF